MPSHALRITRRHPVPAQFWPNVHYWWAYGSRQKLQSVAPPSRIWPRAQQPFVLDQTSCSWRVSLFTMECTFCSCFFIFKGERETPPSPRFRQEICRHLAHPIRLALNVMFYINPSAGGGFYHVLFYRQKVLVCLSERSWKVHENVSSCIVVSPWAPAYSLSLTTL